MTDLDRLKHLEDMQRPTGDCKVFILETVGEIKGLIEKNNEKLNQIEQHQVAQSIKIDALSEKVAKACEIVDGNGVIGHKELVRRFYEHLDSSEKWYNSIWVAAGKVVSILALAIWLLFIQHHLEVMAKQAQIPNPVTASQIVTP